MLVKYAAVLGVVGTTIMGTVTRADAYEQTPDNASTQIQSRLSSQHQALQNKLYRQALYFYFAGEYGQALQQINVNRERFANQSSKSDLFEAGLQVSVGLHNQAAQSLKAFELTRTKVNPTTSSEHSETSPAELLLIAHLQLAEQSIEQGLNHEAQKALAKIQHIPQNYYQQYETLGQLAYWPNTPVLSATVIEAENQVLSSTAYIKLNKALLHLEKEQYELAEAMLKQLKQEHWQAPSQTFWQLVFSPFSAQPSLSEELNGEALQQRAVNDYAQLLLAQLYLKQARYEAAFYELKAFPQHSPYAEAALFMFAYSAQKIKQYSISLSLLNLLKNKYPYSNLGWQSWLMMAMQVEQEKSLEQGLAVHQQAEQFFLQQLAQLETFADEFKQQDDLLVYTRTNDNEQAQQPVNTDALSVAIHGLEDLQTPSPWLNKALENPELKTQLHALRSLDALTAHFQQLQQKSAWIENTLLLNNKRKQRIIEQQQLAKHAKLLSELTASLQRITKKIEQAQITQQGDAFATEAEQLWLQRMSGAKASISSLKPHRNTQDYQQRLSRVAGVLAWNMATKFPERLWQHQKQATALTQLISSAEQQKLRVANSIDSSVNTNDIAQRYQASQHTMSTLNVNVQRLRAKTTKSIKALVTEFANHQQQLLNQHLLTTRHAMAGTLEKMSQVDQRIEKQLSPKQSRVNVSNNRGKEVVND